MIFGPIMQLSLAAQTHDVELDPEIVDETIAAIWRSIGAD